MFDEKVAGSPRRAKKGPFGAGAAKGMRGFARPGTWLAAILIALVHAVPIYAQKASETLLFRDVRVFDGERVIPRTDVLVRDGRIARVGQGVDAPENARLIDGTDRTLLPGFIDAHTHVRSGEMLRRAVVFGVTTELDMFTDDRLAERLKAEQSAGGVFGRADIFSAGTLVTAPGGHGSQLGMAIPTLTSAASAQAFVDARIAEGSDWIKIVYDDLAVMGMSLPTLSGDAMRAVISAAHRRGMLAVVHALSYARAREAVEAGADGLVHLFVDRSGGEKFARLAAERDIFVIPTLSVLASVVGAGVGSALTEDPRLKPYLTRLARARLARSFRPRDGGTAASYAVAEKTVRQLREAGVPILAGTDAPNPGTAHGASMHQELVLLVEAGLTPVEALAAATSAPADAFGLDDRGRIAPGMRADLLLVEGDPTADILATRAIVGVWKGGVRIDRDAFAREVEGVVAAIGRVPEGLADGLVSDFESGEPIARFGTVWVPTTDAMAGGKSTGEVSVVEGGAKGSAGSLHVSGTISDAAAYPWYGAMWSPGPAMMTPADLSSVDGIRFRARGDGKTYRAMVFVQSRGYVPITETFVAGSEWREIAIPWSAFGIDGSEVMAVVFAGGPNPGTFEFRIDDVRLR